MSQTVFRSRTEPLTNDQIARYAPSVLATEAHESRGERYRFIPTIDVLNGLRREGFQPFEVRQTRVRDESRREFTKHMVRLRHPDAQRIMKVGTEFPEIILINSHDGTSSYQISAGIFRLICTNGMVVGDTKIDVRVRHSGNVVNDVIEGSFRVVDEIQGVADRVDTFRAIEMSRDEQGLLAATAARLRWDTTKDVHMPIDHNRLLTPRRWEDRKDDLWTSFNRVQENLIKGGVSGKTSTGKNTTTREVQGVTENVKLNRSLWMLAEGFAALKSGKPLEQILAEATA